MRLAQRALDERFPGIGAAAGERDLAAVAAQVMAALGEDQAGVLRPAEQRQQDRGAAAAVGMQALRRRRIEELGPEVG
ncbi:MAG TPA: hypothetical protein VFH44_09915 [Solirubrobacterales bacterium]|nr:hypothetical protein [Solirubrobacterales bacterium]